MEVSYTVTTKISQILRHSSKILAQTMPEIVEFPDNSVNFGQVLSTDYPFLINRINSLLEEYTESVFSDKEHEVRLYTPRQINPDFKNILIMSGFHGEEPAGPWAILKFLLEHPDMIRTANVSFMPVANVWGFKNNRRTLPDGKPTNHLVNEDTTFLKDTSIISGILKDNIQMISKLSSDGVLSLHEDKTSLGFYLYFLGDVEKNKSLIQDMKDPGFRKFGFKKDGIYTDNGRYELKDGLVANHPDGTIEYALYKKYGSPIAVTSETPAKEANINDRIQIGSDIIRIFLGR